MSKLIEVGIGETVKFNNELYVCVKDDSYLICGSCAFYSTNYCRDIACNDDDREDKTNVHFEKKESTTTSQIISK